MDNNALKTKRENMEACAEQYFLQQGKRKIPIYCIVLAVVALILFFAGGGPLGIILGILVFAGAIALLVLRIRKINKIKTDFWDSLKAYTDVLDEMCNKELVDDYDVTPEDFVIPQISLKGWVIDDDDSDRKFRCDWPYDEAQTNLCKYERITFADDGVYFYDCKFDTCYPYEEMDLIFVPYENIVKANVTEDAAFTFTKKEQEYTIRTPFLELLLIAKEQLRVEFPLDPSSRINAETVCKEIKKRKRG